MHQQYVGVIEIPSLPGNSRSRPPQTDGHFLHLEDREGKNGVLLFPPSSLISIATVLVILRESKWEKWLALDLSLIHI